MNNIKNKFNESFDNITINSDFSKIKNQLNFKPTIKESKRSLKPLIFTLAPLTLILLVMIPLLINGFTKENEPSYQDLMNYEIHLDTISSNTSIENNNINIILPMMFNECNLLKNIDVNSNYEVLQNGKVLDKEHLNLNLGDNNYDVIVYRLNQISDIYKLSITVGK